MRHDVQYHVIGSPHRISTDGSKIMNALIHIIIHNTLGRSHALALHGEQSRQERRADT